MPFKEKLIELNRRGLIHAPDESDDQFFIRCRSAEISKTPPSSSLAKRVFDIEPDWVWVVYDNKGLRFWEGGCTWLRRDHITLQIKKVFQKRESFLGYTQDEVVAHELVHVVRGNFEEPIFEEMLAYQTSSSPLRRFFGPLFRTSNESLIFVAALFAFTISTLFSLFQTVVVSALFSLLITGFGRLLRTHRTFRKARKRLSKIVGPEKVLPVMLRLTDREIIRFSKMNREEISTYAKKMGRIHMRWQQIIDSYFPH